MIQSQDFLSRLGIPYFDCTSQADIDAKTQAVIASYQAVKKGIYQSPAYKVADPSTQTQFDLAQESARTAAVLAMEAAVQAGDVVTAHADLDKVNQLGAGMGIGAIVIKPDIQILANAPGWNGRIAQLVTQGNFPVKVNGTETTLADPAAGAVIEAAIAEVPKPPAVKTTITIQVGQPNDPHPAPVGTTVQDAAGNNWQFIASPFGLFWIRVALLVVLFAGLHPVARAQVLLGCAPQPIAATRNAGTKAMDPMLCWMQNKGAAAVTVNPSDFYTALLGAKISPVGPNVASQIIADSINRLPQSKALKIGKLVATLGAIGYGIYSGNATVPLAVSVGAQNAPQFLNVLEGAIGDTVPTAATYTGGQMTAPLTIPPGGDVPPILVYALKQKNPQPFAGVVVK